MKKLSAMRTRIAGRHYIQQGLLVLLGSALVLGIWAWRGSEPIAATPPASKGGQRLAAPASRSSEGRVAPERSEIPARDGAMEGAEECRRDDEVLVRAIDEDGIAIDSASGIVLEAILGALTLGDREFESNALPAIREAMHSQCPRAGNLRLPMSATPCWILLRAQGFEPTVFRVPDGEQEVVIPMRAAASIVVDQEELRRSGFRDGTCDLSPLRWDGAPVPTEWDLVLVPRGENRLAVARMRSESISVKKNTLTGLSEGQGYRLRITDSRHRVEFAPMDVRAPAFVIPTHRNAEGVELVFTAPLPGEGSVSWTAVDRTGKEPLLAGRLDLRRGDDGVFVPCSSGREWFVDGCGPEWQFAVPVRVSPGQGLSTCTVPIRDLEAGIYFRTQSKMSPTEFTILYASRAGEPGEDLVAVDWDPMARGLRATRVPKGWVVRGLRSDTRLFVHFHPLSWLMPLGAVPSQEPVVVDVPPGKAEFLVAPGDLPVLRGLLVDSQADRVSCAVDQWVEDQGAGFWHQVLVEEMTRSSLAEGRVRFDGCTAARYRLRLRTRLGPRYFDLR
ncbi:MAG: hypothetical protein Fur0037_00810 [Planctomycetota bacterium]